MRRRGRQNPFSLFSFQDIITGLCGILIFFVLIMLVDFISRRDSAPPPPAPPSKETSDESMDALRREVSALERELSRKRAAAQDAVAAADASVSPEVARKMLSEIDSVVREQSELAAVVDDLRHRASAVCAAETNTMAELLAANRALEGKLAEMSRLNIVTLIPERGMAKLPLYVLCGGGSAEVICPTTNGVTRKPIASGNMVSGVVGELKGYDSSRYAVVLLVRPSGAGLMDGLASKIRSLGFGCGRDPLEEDATVNVGGAGGEDR